MQCDGDRRAATGSGVEDLNKRAKVAQDGVPCLAVTLRDAGVSNLSGWLGCTCCLFALRGGSGTVVGSFDVTFGVFCCGGRDCEGTLLCRTVTACLRAYVSLSLSGSRGKLVLGF